jgi:drug/metabolite transporter (DMT)-like permease
MATECSGSFSKTVVFTGLALLAFAANSVFCRLALGEGSIDAASFTVVRLLSGVVVLFVLVKVRQDKKGQSSAGSWSASLMLFLYALTFSFAYITLDTGTGALILFGWVQITMILLSLFSGNRLHISEWAGIVVAFMGFVYLMLPDVTTPSAKGFSLMTVAGISWGIYTVKGRGSKNPVVDTAYNFSRTIPFLLVLTVVGLNDSHFSSRGILLGVLSGGIASGIGYAIWYTALGGLSVTQAAVVQSLVPVVAAVGGVILMSEALPPRLVFSATMILGGILMVILGRHYFVLPRERP